MSASSQEEGSEEAPREREEMEQTGFGLWGRSHGPTPAPLPTLPQVGSGCPTCSWSPAGSKFPQTWPGEPGRASCTTSARSHGAQDTAGQQGRGPAPQRMLRRGVGRRGQNTSWTHVLHPGGSLSYPASVCLPMKWAPAGDSGDRGARRRLGAGCVASLGLALQRAATCRRPPTNAAPGHGS